jgi:type VI secretion system protein ImpE
MSAEDILRSGDLAGTLRSLQDEVRAKPADPRPRIFLFQLLCVLGQWERALNQITALRELDGTVWPLTKSYSEVIRCEVFRAGVFEGRRTPLVFGKPEEWIALLIESVRLIAEGRHVQADDLRNRALESAEPTPGTINGQPFAWIADADSRLGPVIEAIVEGRYYWIPFRRIREIQLIAPADLRDLVWLPAQFIWSNGGDTYGFIPTRYPGTEGIDDDALRLSRKTDWREISPGVFLGSGQRMLTTDGGDYPLLDARHIVLETPAE